MNWSCVDVFRLEHFFQFVREWILGVRNKGKENMIRLFHMDRFTLNHGLVLFLGLGFTLLGGVRRGRG